MNLLIWLVLGAVLGKVVSAVAGSNDPQTVFMNMLIGALGALFTGWLVSPLFGLTTTLREFSAAGLLVALFGAGVLLGLTYVIGRGRMR